MIRGMDEPQYGNQGGNGIGGFGLGVRLIPILIGICSPWGVTMARVKLPARAVWTNSDRRAHGSGSRERNWDCRPFKKY